METAELKDKNKFDKLHTWVFIIVQDMWRSRMIIRYHFAEVICKVIRNRIETCILVIL
jgi:hypothetical protein